ncbi:MAG: putative manganese-dependent inorganic diphosphatase [Gemmiger sp.]|nr:putative manganese-dependent inorganic diphosphatase [Gemmiger sp.]
MPQGKTPRKVNVIGHINPDTDSICSAIAYAYLKNQASEMHCEARRAGHISRETEFVLHYFGVEPPRLCTDVSPQMKDIDIRRQPGIDAEMSVKAAWAMMRDAEIDTLCVTDDADELLGIITVKDIATANMDLFDTGVLAAAHTSYLNILATLEGQMAVGDPEARVECGAIYIGAASPDQMEEYLHRGDLVLVSNRYENQICAIECGAGCIVVCGGSALPRTIAARAAEKGCCVITTPYDTYAAARLVSQAAPVRHFMRTQGLLKFSVNTPTEDARRVMASVRHRYFPILDEAGKYCGVVSRRNLLNLHRKQIILVDHNEKTQAVDGLAQADVLEIIDHHRIGTLETDGPVYFRNVPVGCTATIIFQMYLENEVDIPRHIAGLLLSAILSDTLMFRSPTSTPQDQQAAQALARLAEVDIPTYAEQMFEAGGDLTGKTAEEVFLSDFKVFSRGDAKFGVGQSSYMTARTRAAAEALVGPYLQQAAGQEGIPLVFYMFTDVQAESTDLMYCGPGAEKIVQRAFGVTTTGTSGKTVLPGVVSRKKQLIPPLMAAMQEQLL